MKRKTGTQHVIQREVISLATIAEKKLYEGMFLVDSAKAASNWDGINSAIKRILERAGAEIVSMRKWDDRKLAYDIRGVGRGTYILTYFRADGGKIQEIEKAVQLSENIIRVLVLGTEQMSKDDIEKDTPATKAEKEKQKAVSEKRRETEPSSQDDREEESRADQDEKDQEARAAEEVELARDDEEPQEAETTEPAGRGGAEEFQEPQESQPKTVSDD
jgi:small subunit ribosomal protein S6